MSNRVRRGLGLPNRQWERWTDAEIAALWDLAPETLLVLLYGPDSPALAEQRAVLRDYCQTYRDTRLLFRPFEPNIPRWAPSTWADECQRRAALIGLPGEMVCDNERNLAIEGGSEDWEGHARWLLAYAARWREISRDLLHLGALSPNGAYRVGWRRYHELGVFAAYDIADAHCYPGVLADWRELAAMSAKPVSITEFNQTDPRGYFEIVGDGARDAVWFILSGTQDQRPYWLMGSPYYQSFKAPVPSPEPTEPVVGEGFRKAAALVGGFVENEIWHLPGSDGKTSLAVGARGYAVWRAKTNRTIAICDSGEVWADSGNLSAEMRRLR